MALSVACATMISCWCNPPPTVYGCLISMTLALILIFVWSSVSAGLERVMDFAPILLGLSILNLVGDASILVYPLTATSKHFEYKFYCISQLLGLTGIFWFVRASNLDRLC